MFNYLFFGFFLVIICNGLIDDWLMINCMGYGIMFDKIGELVDFGGIIYYIYICLLIILNYIIFFVDEIDCDCRLFNFF